MAIIKKEWRSIFAAALFMAAIISMSAYCRFFTETFEPMENDSMMPGDFATSYLRSDRYDSLEIEIDYVHGARPNDTALDEFVYFIDEKNGGICSKPKGIIYRIDDEIPLSDYNVKLAHDKYHYYTQDDISALEGRYREKFRHRPNIVLYILYLDLPFRYGASQGISGSDAGNYDDPGARILGRAQHASTIALFKNETITDMTLLNTTTEPPHPEKPALDMVVIEYSVLVHEFGHIVALVSDQSHQDKTHTLDCRNDCVMNYMVDHLSEASPYLSPSYTPFLCKDCADEMDALKGT